MIYSNERWKLKGQITVKLYLYLSLASKIKANTARAKRRRAKSLLVWCNSGEMVQTVDEAINEHQLKLKLSLTEPTQSADIKTEMPKAELVKPELIKSELVKPELVKPELVKTEVLKPEAAKPEAVNAEAVFALEADEFIKRLEEMSPEQIHEICSNLEFVSKAKGKAKSLKLFGPLVTTPAEPRNMLSILLWWETRRVIYNIVVGMCGLPGVFLLLLAHEPLGFITFGVLFYAFMANVCYTAGAVSETVARQWFGIKVKDYAPVAFSLGTAFSIALTLFCSMVCTLVFLFAKF